MSKVFTATMVSVLALTVTGWAGGACCGAKSAGACCTAQAGTPMLMAQTEGAAPVVEAPAAAPAVEAKPQTTCPVMSGNTINKKFYADYKGKRVYLCCGACPPAFKADPEKYMKKLADEGVTLEDAPAAQE